MCGVVGIIKKEGFPITWEEHQDFLSMLEEAQSRGNQATGVIYVYEDGKIFCMKSPSASLLAADFIPHRKGIRALLGHTRKSTGGMPKDNFNNHPHETPNWALIHNGTCWTSVLDKDLGLKTKCDTEEFIRMFEYMANKNKEYSLQNILKKSLEEMDGSWSLAFVNKKNGELFLTTNGSSPLSCVYFKQGMLFSSLASYFTKTSIYDETGNSLLKTSILKSNCKNIK